MDASFIIVSWNVRDLLRACLASILHTALVRFEIIVVDNASTDGTVEMVRKEFPNVKLIAQKVNTGFAAANMTGVQQSQGRHLILLNPDTVWHSGADKKLVSWLDEHTNAGVVGPALVYPNGSPQDSVRRFPTLLVLCTYLLKLHRVFPHIPFIDTYLYRGIQPTIPSKVDQVMGACMVIPKHVFTDLGGFDTSFYIWFEEVDLCKRITKNNKDVWFLPSVTITHYGGESFSQVASPTKQRLFIRSARLYARKHLGILSWLLLTAITPISILLGNIQGALHTHEQN